MTDTQIAIEGYNKERYEIQKELLERATYASDSKYDCFRDRIEQIDKNIERLMSFNIYPVTKD